ncbi:ParA family protein [Rothia nasisuis]|uniref:ParA family protein n=1 Tax=Rothia nasisuis TaxID=2109647 RepID=UPI001F242665|nr:ParA family protein [Rothia nasisuis]
MTSVVSISSLKGGVGKTSVALGLASAAQARGLRVLVVDMDPHGDASTGLGVRAVDAQSGADMGAMLAAPGNFTLTEEIRPSSWVALGALGNASATGKDAGVWVGRASARLARLEQEKATEALPNLAQLLKPALPDFDLILVDCPPTLGHLTEIAWAASDRVLSVAEPSLFSVAGSERTLRALARFEANTEHAVSSASIVVNKVREGDPEHSYRNQEMRQLFGDLVAEPSLPETPLLQRIQGAAYPIHYWPEAEAQQLADAFSELLTGLVQAPEASQGEARAS